MAVLFDQRKEEICKKMHLQRLPPRQILLPKASKEALETDSFATMLAAAYHGISIKVDMLLHSKVEHLAIVQLISVLLVQADPL